MTKLKMSEKAKIIVIFNFQPRDKKAFPQVSKMTGKFPGGYFVIGPHIFFLLKFNAIYGAEQVASSAQRCW
jgi:hypothetical protein